MASNQRVGPGFLRAMIRHDPAFGIATQIVRSELHKTQLSGVLLNDVPDNFFGDALAPGPTGLTDASKHAATLDACSTAPFTDQPFNPFRNRDRSNMPTLSNQIHDCPVFVTPLKMTETQISQFTAPKATAQELPVMLGRACLLL